MSDLATYVNWIGPGFSWLDDNWAEGQAWGEARDGFLGAIGVTDQDLATPQCRVLGIAVGRIDEMAEAHRRYTLVAAAERHALVQAAFTQWQQEGGGAAAETGESAESESVEGSEPQYVEGRGWMRYDAATGEWVDAPAPDGSGEAEAPGGSGEAEAPTGGGEAQYVEGHGWMRYDAASGQWVPAEQEASETELDEGEVPSAPPVPGGTAPTAETPPDAPPPPSETAPVEVGASDPELAAAVAELPQETQDLFTEAVQEELAPVLEEIMGEIEGLED
ncbi:MAG: hypothetical protein QOI15_2043, partial [Pseudonocardiales bacterium]|nr:hypothetical protein [Pseudonocardiales bacterium]